jgi:hypothetical protein
MTTQPIPNQPHVKLTTKNHRQDVIDILKKLCTTYPLTNTMHLNIHAKESIGVGMVNGLNTLLGHCNSFGDRDNNPIATTIKIALGTSKVQTTKQELVCTLAHEYRHAMQYDRKMYATKPEWELDADLFAWAFMQDFYPELELAHDDTNYEITRNFVTRHGGITQAVAAYRASSL